ncbi:class I SAM-dependent methyltransferase [Aequorivita marisscotiae]|uniref:Class I SAM-dependent methyltransferase n=1 Tax=Aequorivita marisscotiae TaxID=3040348 RepID=A0ABY8KY09_9FLAO|nr:class I SAM-dependent methyltransferase [Aequorivita sp. Ant34-E75]WGF92706.1 class I SAM-dependent methyltransferase [Aequorivita sp. Ant34-E75]
MANTCRICGNSEENKTFVAKEMMYGLRETFEYFECSNCGCLQISEFPADMGKYYPGDYYSFDTYDGKKFEGAKGAIKKKQYEYAAIGGTVYKNTLAHLIGKKEYEIFNDLDVTKITRILDVGCGNGRNFVYPLAEVGFKNVMGCDPYLKETIQYENGLTIKKSSVFDMDGTFDIITYHHAFEHLPDPLENLQKVHELLAPGGVCIIRIPTVSSFAWKHYGVNWVQLDAPRHFFLHSQKSMQLLADNSNFDLYKIEYDSTHFQFTGSEKYIKDIPLSAPKTKGFSASLQRKVQNYQYGQKAKQLNKEKSGDQAAFYLRKK